MQSINREGALQQLERYHRFDALEDWTDRVKSKLEHVVFAALAAVVLGGVCCVAGLAYREIAVFLSGSASTSSFLSTSLFFEKWFVGTAFVSSLVFYGLALVRRGLLNRKNAILPFLPTHYVLASQRDFVDFYTGGSSARRQICSPSMHRLFAAAHFGDLELLSAWLNEGGDPYIAFEMPQNHRLGNIRIGHFQTPLEMALDNEQWECAALLLTTRMIRRDFSVVDRAIQDGRMPLDRANYEGHYLLDVLLDILLERSYQLNFRHLFVRVIRDPRLPDPTPDQLARIYTNEHLTAMWNSREEPYRYQRHGFRGEENAREITAPKINVSSLKALTIKWLQDRVDMEGYERAHPYRLSTPLIGS